VDHLRLWWLGGGCDSRLGTVGIRTLGHSPTWPRTQCPSITRRETLVATGRQESEATEGNRTVAVWRSDVPIRVAGFNYGEFRVLSRTDEETGLELRVYTNPRRSRMAEDTMADAMNASRVATSVASTACRNGVTARATVFRLATRVIYRYTDAPQRPPCFRDTRDDLRSPRRR